MNDPTLGRFERVELRDAWAREDGDFTPWLARPENLEVLADTLGLELETEAVEKDVGPFRADILCREPGSDDWVLIENQLERTDHVHLGQLLTYAAGLHAVTVVWIAARFTDEHRAALDWLNERTDEQLRFFGLEIELWRIGESPPAPRFNVVSKPNDWSREVTRAAGGTAGTTRKAGARKGQVDFPGRGIPVGSILTCIWDEKETCKVLPDNNVEFHGEAMSLRQASQRLAPKYGKKETSATGVDNWKFDGTTVYDWKARYEGQTDDS